MSTLALLVMLMLLGSRSANDQHTQPQPLPPRPPRPRPGPTPTAALPPPSAPPAQQQAAHAQQQQAASSPPPWPQAVPPGLPPFPSGWTPDNPPSSAVVTRAWQLLPELWKSGRPGATKTEQTQGKWITYLASSQGGKRSVIAYRLKDAAAAPAANSSARPASSTVLVSTKPTTGVATLKQGSTGPAVVKLQQLLGIGADGKFGPATKAAVVAFQTGHHLTPDGIVGPQTWAALTTRAA